MRQKKLKWGLIGVPLLAAFIAVRRLQALYPLYPVIQLRIDLASLLWILSGFLSVLLLIYFIIQRFFQTAQIQTMEKSSQKHRLFLQRLDHELKNPLSIIQAGIALLRSDLNTNPSAQKKIEENFETTLSQINHQALRIARLISDLRKLSDIEIQPLELSPVNVEELLIQLIKEIKLEQTGQSRPIHLSTPQAPWQLPAIRADEDLMYLSFYNLLDNALKYSSCADAIEVRAYEDHNQVRIEVANHGIGIPKDEIDKIWGGLYRAQNARSVPGYGLGLAIVHKIISRHAGDITVQSREGEGTRFMISLPKK